MNKNNGKMVKMKERRRDTIEDKKAEGTIKDDVFKVYDDDEE